MGMEKIIFDKYNTLIRHGEVDFPDPSFKEALLNAQKIFGKENVMMISNLHKSEYHLTTPESMKFFDPII